jgi:hypothetical protein
MYMCTTTYDLPRSKCMQEMLEEMQANGGTQSGLGIVSKNKCSKCSKNTQPHTVVIRSSGHVHHVRDVTQGPARHRCECEL